MTEKSKAVDDMIAKFTTPPKFGDVDEMYAAWWARDGRFIDTDPDVPWEDKRKDFAALAFAAGVAASRNYVADDAEEPSQFVFANGRAVTIDHDDDPVVLYVGNVRT